MTLKEKHNPEFQTFAIALLHAIGAKDLLASRYMALTENCKTTVRRTGKLLGGKVTIIVEFEGENIL